MKKVLLTFGTRPEAIKMAPVIKELQKYPEAFVVKVCVTAQHREFLDQVLEIFAITPDFDLDVMKENQDLSDITTGVLLGMKKVFEQFRPDLMLVHGDTTTTLAASLAAYYQKIPVGHVEAGLRTHNIYSPFPEEINRQVTSKIAAFHFAPTERNKKTLEAEKTLGRILVTGNTVIDALFMVLQTIKDNQQLKEQILSTIRKQGYPIATSTGRKIILVTGHRRENFGQGFVNICEAIKDIASRYPDVDIVYPVHLNPNVREPVTKLLSGKENIYLIEPLDYTSFVYLMDRSYLLLSDSGGVQEEGPSLGKPVLVMREETERPEAEQVGTVKLVGTDQAKITKAVDLLLSGREEYESMAQKHNPYGDGKAAERIVDFLRTPGAL